MNTAIIIGFLIAWIMLAIVYGAMHRHGEKRYQDMYESMSKRNEALAADVVFWRDRHERYRIDLSTQPHKASVLAGKVELYEKLLNKFLDEHSDTTDASFIFEGRCYLPTEFETHSDKKHARTLTVDFVEAPLEFRKVEKV